MGGGPRNREHKNVSKEVKQARRKAFLAKIEKKKKKKEKKNGAPPKIKNFEAILRSPIRRELRPYVANIEAYVTESWLPLFPCGARLRKLQRDLAWRMNRKKSPGKLEYRELLPIVGMLEQKGLVTTRVREEEGVLVIMPLPSKDTKTDERSSDNAKSSNAA